MKQNSKKGSKADEETLETPTILKTENKRDISKQCGYCKTKG
jgi:hypothetical protein